ncbi:hypothetical protein CBS101457_005435 [Exobasidium rhododendri]|nr:hypothetical protein CBS101457_005435 [Exobasidium rhododendri]
MADCDTGLCPPSEDPLDAKTFTPPANTQGEQLPGPAIVIEFCNRCRWLHRATWVQTELFLTFPDTEAESSKEGNEGETSNGSKYSTGGKGLKSITLIPCNAPETGGRFRVWLRKERRTGSSDNESRESRAQKYGDGSVVLLWDRKIQAGFPELKELKQLIRDEIAPSHKLGHSDKKVTSKEEIK